MWDPGATHHSFLAQALAVEPSDMECVSRDGFSVRLASVVSTFFYLILSVCDSVARCLEETDGENGADQCDGSAPADSIQQIQADFAGLVIRRQRRLSAASEREREGEINRQTGRRD